MGKMQEARIPVRRTPVNTPALSNPADENRFPIYTHLIKKGEFSGDGGWGVYSQDQIDTFKDSILVEGIDPADPSVSDTTLLSLEDFDHIQKRVDDLGVIKLPYPRMWVEFKYVIDVSEYNMRKGKKGKDRVPGTTHGAAFVWETPMGNIQLSAFVRLTTGHILNLGIGLDVKLKESGEVHEVSFGVASSQLSSKLQDIVEIQAIWAVGYPVLYALGLMNCKNVTLESKVQKSRSSNPETRKRTPKLEYHTILLPQSRHLGVITPGKGGVSAAGIHKVRGHFKTYGPEAPLFGKHTGKYWWPWQVRGDANKGVIISDYKVGRK